MRIEGHADAWGVVIAWTGVLLGGAWILTPVVLGEELYLYPGALVALSVGAAAVAMVASYWANIERYGRSEGFIAEWYRPFKELSVFWLASYLKALLLLILPTTLFKALRESGPKVATLLLLLSVPAGALLSVGPTLLVPAAPPADGAAQEAVTALQTDPETAQFAQYCTSQKASSPDPTYVYSIRLNASIALGPEPVQVGSIEYAREKGAQTAKVALLNTASSTPVATMTMKYMDERWLPCGELVTR